MQTSSLVAVVLSAVALASLLTYSQAAGILEQSDNCEEDFAYCPQSRQCIATSWVCDRDPDCHYQEDEQNCAYQCDEDEFQCADSSCINHAWLCDGDPDCDDESDEMNCPAGSIASQDYDDQ